MVKNDLYDYEPLKIYQDNTFFKFSLDSILLAEYVSSNKKSSCIIDLCTGNAAIPLILSYYGFNNLTGIELQPEVFELAKQSIIENNKKIEIINEDIKNIKKRFASESFDIVTINPPYFKNLDTSIKNENNIKAIARHEIKINLDEIFKNSSYLLKNNGILYMIHRSERLFEISGVSQKYHFAIKETAFLASKENNYDLVIIKFVKNGNDGTKIKAFNNLNRLKTYKKIFER